MRGLLLALVFFGCDTVLAPRAAYTGDGTRSGETGQMTSDLAPDGTLTASTQLFSSSAAGTRVAILQVDDMHFDADIGNGCRVRFEHDHWINVSGGTATVVEGTTCDVQVDAFPTPATITGTATALDDPPRLTLDLVGEARAGDADRAGYRWGSWRFTFDGSAAH